MVPPHVKEGKLSFLIKEGEYTVEEIIAKIDCGNKNIVEVSMITKWPIRKPRPIKKACKHISSTNNWSKDN